MSKKQYLDFLESHRQTVLYCQDIASNMASFYLVFSGVDGNPKPDQRKALNEKMALIGQTLEKLAAALKAQQ